MNQSLDLCMMSTTGFWSPPDKAPELSESTERLEGLVLEVLEQRLRYSVT
jgi:hypothetical protein